MRLTVSQSVNLISGTASAILKKIHGKGTDRYMDIATTRHTWPRGLIW